MSKFPEQSRLRRENDRPPPLQSAEMAAATSSRSSLQKPSSSGKQTYLPKDFGYPFRSLLREPEPPIPPPPTGEVPATNSSHRSLEESSLDPPLRYPVLRSGDQVQMSILQSKREASFPASSLQSSLRGTDNKPFPASQQPSSSQNENASKSPGRDEMVNPTHHQLALEDAGSPMLQTERSPEKQAVTNRNAASVSTMPAKVGRSGVNGMHVESGFLRRSAMTKVEFGAFGLRVLEVVLCMISFSVMAADKTKGWAGDSFDRYPEFRYCISMNVIAFVYSLFQVYAQFHHMMEEKCYYFDFFMDQVLAYLLLSASSAAAARNDDWISMFGSDKFTDMMNGSIAMSFLAFFAFASSSVISAEKLFTWKP